MLNKFSLFNLNYLLLFRTRNQLLVDKTSFRSYSKTLVDLTNTRNRLQICFDGGVELAATAVLVAEAA